MLEVQGRKIPETLEEVISTNHTIVAIHDMQKYFCNPNESGPTYTPGPNPATQEEATKNIVRLREAARSVGVRVLYTYSTNHRLSTWKSSTDYELYRERELIRKTGKLKENMSKLGEVGMGIIDELKPEPGEIILEKPHTDAFLGTDYHNMLRTLGIRTIIECGRSIEIGLEPTARTGTLRGYLMVVVKDCIMGRNVEYIKDSMRWFERSVILCGVADITKAWKS